MPFVFFNTPENRNSPYFLHIFLNSREAFLVCALNPLPFLNGSGIIEEKGGGQNEKSFSNTNIGFFCFDLKFM